MHLPLVDKEAHLKKLFKVPKKFVIVSFLLLLLMANYSVIVSFLLLLHMANYRIGLCWDLCKEKTGTDT